MINAWPAATAANVRLIAADVPVYGPKPWRSEIFTISALTGPQGLRLEQ
jgi:hypothetical protein